MLERVALLAAALLCAVPAAAETLKLSNGDQVSGEVVEADALRVVLVNPVLGRIEIPADQILPPEEPERDAGAFGTGLFRDWTRRIGLGVSGAEGNTQNMAVNVELELSKEDDERRWKFATAYYWGTSDGDKDNHKAFVDLERDWKLADSRFYLFARSGYDYDEFRSFNHRVDGNAGVGYWLRRSPHWKLGTRLGAGVSYQWQNEAMLRPELVVGVDSIWPIAEGHKLEFHGDIFQDLADLGEFRTRSTAQWRLALTEILGLSFGVIHEYVSDTRAESNDVTYNGAVTYDF